MSFVYFARLFNETESFYKIGFTNHKPIEDSFKKIPYQYTILSSLSTKNESDSFIVEQHLLKEFDKRYFKYNPKKYVSGMGSCFIGSNENTMKSDFDKSANILFKIEKANVLSLGGKTLPSGSNTVELNNFAKEFLKVSDYKKIATTKEINEYTSFLLYKLNANINSINNPSKPKKKRFKR